MQSEKGKQALQQIGAQERADVNKIKAQGQLDQALQGLKGKQSLQQIGAQGDVEESLQAVSYTHLTLPTIYSV